jgi:cyclopropane fatty-acyl-phospholipid synthase-like methyltransferase
LLHFQQCFCIRGHWILDSAHYQKTLEAWQENLDARRSDVHRLFQATYGARSAAMTGAMARLPDGRAGL